MVVWEALDALSHQFELCAIDADSRVVVVIDTAVSADRVALIRAAIARSGADSVEVQSIGGGATSVESPLLADIATTADLIVTTKELPSIRLDENQQLLVLGDSAPQAFPPHATMARRVRALHALVLDADDVLTVRDPHGTDLRFDLGANTSASDSGLFDDAHLRASYPAGWVSSTPSSTSVNGQLVIMPGDANLNAQRSISSPVRLQIIDDHVSTIDGDNPDADVFRALLEYAQQPAAYGIAEVTIGMNPGRERARAFDPRLLDTQLSRLLAGVITISFGKNLLADRPCDQTVTLVLPGRSAHVGAIPVLIDGQLQGDFAPDVYEV